jgi:hypothetical protein
LRTHADCTQFPYNLPDDNRQEIYRKRDDGDHEVFSTTTDHCRWIRRRGRGSTGDRLRRDTRTLGWLVGLPNAGQPYSAIGANPDLPAVNLPGGGGSIPCTGHNSGQCIGLSEEQQAPVVTPESTIGSSPTVTGFDDNAG